MLKPLNVILALLLINVTALAETVMGSTKESWGSYKATYRNSPVIKSYEDYVKKNTAWAEKLRTDDKKEQQSFLEKYGNENVWKSNGGVTDGGGNRVNQDLYDYWIKVGTEVVSIDSLLKWNTELIELVEFVKTISPVTREINFRGWFYELHNVAKNQNWILDIKPIKNVNCWNLSPTVTALQEITACNSVHEVKIHAAGIFSMTDESQAGLIMHEFLLSWAREQFGTKMSKYAIEDGVQQLNAALRTKSKNLVFETLRRYFPASQILSVDESIKLVDIYGNIAFTGVMFCKNQEVANTGFILAASSSAIARKYLGNSLLRLTKALRSKGTQDEILTKAIFCYELGVTPISSNDLLSKKCKQLVETELLDFTEITNMYSTSSEIDQSYKWSHSIAQKCMDAESMRDEKTKAEIYIQTLEYFNQTINRFRYNGQGPFSYHFLTGDALPSFLPTHEL